MKTVPIDASLRKIVSVQRNNLQRKSLLKNLNGFSKETRTLFNNYMKMLIGEVGTNIINDQKKVIKEKISELKDKYDT